MSKNLSTPFMLNQNIINLRSRVDEVVKDLHEFTSRIGHTELMTTVSDLRNRIQEPYMFVIVGEVKSGKSSFVNALLDSGEEICKVGPAPVTDTVQQIIYGDKEEVVVINEHLKKIFRPIDILKDIAIVDTPGTNAIIQQHQEITERFIPVSDLIVFVFEAKNPYRQSSWAFFDYIHSDWRKKIIFVLQQKDLMPENDLAVNIEGVRQQAIKKGIENPHVFAVSAKQELEDLRQKSGFIPIRNYISENITGGKAPYLKLGSSISTAQNINEKIHIGLADRKKQYEYDIAFREDIKNTLESQEAHSKRQVSLLLENLLGTYDRITSDTERELREGLSFFSLLRRSVSSIFSKKQSAKAWLEDLAKNLEQDMQNKMAARLQESVGDLAESIQQMAKMIDLKIKNSQTILKNNHDIFSDIAEKRHSVIHDLQNTFTQFLNDTENFSGQELFPDKASLTPGVATGSGLAVIGIILTAVTNMAVFDVTGGVLAAVGVLFAGISTGTQRRKIMKDYRKEIDNGREKLENELSTTLNTYITNIKSKIDNNFSGFDTLLTEEEKQIGELDGLHASIQERLEELSGEVRE